MFDFLKKKPNNQRPAANVPVAEVRHLQSIGMSDKDVIKQLKEQGYGFGEIEKAMMHAVKGGVSIGEEPIPMSPMGEVGEEMSIQAAQPMQEEQRYTNEPEQQSEDLFSQYREETPTLGELEGDMGQIGTYGMQQESISPDVAIEELVEGVVDEKWDDFSKRMERNDSIVSELRTENRILQNKLERLSHKPNADEELSDKMDQKMEDLEVRIASVERAFKQMLPNLTKNIQELTLLAKTRK